jgi:hypothetical protein
MFGTANRQPFYQFMSKIIGTYVPVRYLINPSGRFRMLACSVNNE